MNQNQNALEEHVTGAPCSGNASYSLVDSDAEADNPTTSAFDDHSGASTSTNQPLVSVPLWAEAFGGIDTDGTTAGFAGEWDPPGMNYGVSEFFPTPSEVFTRVLAYVPDSPAADGSSKLEAIMLVCSPVGATLTDHVRLRMECFNSGGTGAGSKTANFAAITGNFYKATVSSIACYPDALNLIKFTVEPIDIDFSGTGNTFRVLGICLHLKAS